LRRIASKAGNGSADYSCAMQYTRLIYHADAKSMADAGLMMPMPRGNGRVSVSQFYWDNGEFQCAPADKVGMSTRKWPGFWPSSIDR